MALYEHHFQQQKKSLGPDNDADYDAISLVGSEDLANLSMERRLLSHQLRQNCHQTSLLSHPTRPVSHQRHLEYRRYKHEFKWEHLIRVLWPRRFYFILEILQGFFFILGQEFPTETQLRSSLGYFRNHQYAWYNDHQPNLEPTNQKICSRTW